MKPTRVLIVEDSPVVRELLTAIVRDDPRFEIAAAVPSAEEALRRLDRLAPDVISLDIRLPGMNGLEATRRIMTERPTPIVVIAASVDSDDLNIAMNALRSGALAVIEKPAGADGSGFEEMAGNIRTQLFIMSRVKVVRRWSESSQPSGEPAGLAAASGLPPTPAVFSPGLAANPSPVQALGIACSTGGPNALSVVLRDLPPSLPCPVLLVQHLPPTFVASFASWIATICPFEVRIVREPEMLRPGCIYLSCPERHLSVVGNTVTTTGAPPVEGQRPSANTLFLSMSRTFGAAAIGILMTGMGNDGAEGLLALRRAGAQTIAEDESTAIVHGMPGAAIALGAATETLPLHLIAPRVAALLVCGGAYANRMDRN